MLQKGKLEELYGNGHSVMEISDELGVSYHKVRYWIEKFDIPRRTRSEATYAKRNPDGDPFCIKTKFNRKEAELKGMGLGLYWGEGNKANKTSVRISNTDPVLIRKFIDFLTQICGTSINALRFSLQVFDDMDVIATENYWQSKLTAKPEQFYKTTISQSRGEGTYKRKTRFGVLTVYCHNKKLRDALIDMLR